jgi:4-hydroxy-4-methyl-2-oxoglutarate aldolase
VIEDPPLLTVRRKFQRPSAAQLAAFDGVPTGFVVDAMDGRGALDYRIKSYGSVTRFHGSALTCDAGPADVLALLGTLDEAKPGDVIVCATDGFTATAVTGDLVIGMLKNVGVVGFVTDGLVRDTPGIRDVGLPCYAAGVTPNSPVKTGPGTIGFPIVVGGVAVSPGDLVIGDEDGVVVVPFARIDETIEHLATIKALEADMDAKVKGGLRRPGFMDAILKPGTIRVVD